MIKANFIAYGNYVTDGLAQWEIDRVLEVRGLNLVNAPEVHFSNANMDRAIVRQSTMENHVVTVKIPNSLLQDPLRIYAHIGVYEGSTFKVVETVEIPVAPRKRPADYQIEDTDEEIYSFKRLENELANRATKEQVANIIAHNNDTNGNTELIDMRYGADGVTYPSAGEAVREQVIGKEPTYGEYAAAEYEIHEGAVISTKTLTETSMSNGRYIFYTVADEPPYVRVSGKAQSVPEWPLCAFLDENNNVLSWYGTKSTVEIDVLLQVPGGTVSILINGDNEICKLELLNRRDLKEDMAKLRTGASQIWNGRKIVLIGTSVGFGQYAAKAYIHEAEKVLGFNVVNCSVPGNAIHTEADGSIKNYGSLALTIAEYADQGVAIPDNPKPYTPGGSYNDYYRTWENVFTPENADADLYIFAVLPNNGDFALTDWNAFDFDNWAYTDGSSFADHRSTFLGAMLYLMDKMYAHNPSARMALLVDSNFARTKGLDNVKTLAEKYNIPLIDLWGKINTTPRALLNLKSKNGTDEHPSTFAHELMGRALVGDLMSIS